MLEECVLRLQLAAYLIAVLCLAAGPPAAAAEPASPRSFELANVPDGAAAPGVAGEVLGGTAGPAPSADASGGDDPAVTIVLGGDLGLGGSREPVHPDGAYRHGTRHAWDKLTAGLRPLIDGHLNFANLETVVSDRKDLAPLPKAYNFRSHPAGLAHLVSLGFNMLSAANNHAIDYGEEGLAETIRHLDAARGLGLGAWHGIGLDRERALLPSELRVKGSRVLLTAVGIGGRGFPAAPRQRPGVLSYHTDFTDAVTGLASAEGDLRILSVHYGTEMQVRPAATDVSKLRDVAVAENGIDIVVGHHAHVPAGVQDIGGRLVFYGLGNLLHPGMQDMARFDVCRDYGLLVRVHLSPDEEGRLRARAIEAVPLTEMHLATRAMPADEARTRIEVLNHLAAGLDDKSAGATGVRFAAGPEGHGLHCLHGADRVPGRIGAMCRGWQPPDAADAPTARRISAACGGAIFAARSRSQDRHAARPERARVTRTRARGPAGADWGPLGSW